MAEHGGRFEHSGHNYSYTAEHGDIKIWTYDEVHSLLGGSILPEKPAFWPQDGGLGWRVEL